VLRDEHAITHTTLQLDHIQDDQPDSDEHCSDAHGPIHRSA
jgi:cobalt-zinc-cadmium efflux system protein